MLKKEVIIYYLKLLETILKKFIFNLKNFGIKLSFLNMFGEFTNFYLLKCRKFAINLRKKQHETIQKTLTKKYHSLIEEYKTKTITTNENSKIIWTYWAQGIDKSPNIVKKCIKSMEENSGEYELIILTNKNYKEYVNLPNEIITKVENNKISITHFSDILRMKLLSEYGGIWVDATMFFNNNVFKEFDDKIFNSAYRAGKWSIFFIGGKPNKLFKFASDFLIQYNLEYDEFISYFLLDHIISIAYNSFDECKKYIDNATLKNNNMFFFIDNGGCPYSKEEFNKICNKYEFFKLSYKNSRNNPMQDKQGNLTYLGYFSKK